MSWSRLLVVALVATAAGCGFHLRGEYNVPFASVFVSSTGASQVATQLKRELATGVPIVYRLNADSTVASKLDLAA